MLYTEFTNFEKAYSGTPPVSDIYISETSPKNMRPIGTITKYTLTYDETVKVDKQGKKLPIPKWKIKAKTKTHLYEVVFTLDEQRFLFIVVNDEAPAKKAHKIEYKHFANNFKSLKSEGSLMIAKSENKPQFLGVFNAPTARKALAKAHELAIEFLFREIESRKVAQETQTAPKQPQKSPEQVQLTWRLTDDCKIEYERIPLAGDLTVDSDIKLTTQDLKSLPTGLPINVMDMVNAITYFTGVQQAGKPAKWHRYLAKVTNGSHSVGLKQYKDYLENMDGDSEQIPWYEFDGYDGGYDYLDSLDENSVSKIGIKGAKIINMYLPNLPAYDNIINVIKQWEMVGRPAPDPYPQYIPNLYRQNIAQQIEITKFDKQDSFESSQQFYFGNDVVSVEASKLYYDYEGTVKLSERWKSIVPNRREQGKLRTYRYQINFRFFDGLGRFDFNVLGSYSSKGWDRYSVNNTVGYATSKEAYAAAKQFIIAFLVEYGVFASFTLDEAKDFIKRYFSQNKVQASIPRSAR
jgi:hypothetical protein